MTGGQRGESNSKSRENGHRVSKQQHHRKIKPSDGPHLTSAGFCGRPRGYRAPSPHPSHPLGDYLGLSLAHSVPLDSSSPEEWGPTELEMHPPKGEVLSSLLTAPHHKRTVQKEQESRGGRGGSSLDFSLHPGPGEKNASFQMDCWPRSISSL